MMAQTPLGDGQDYLDLQRATANTPTRVAVPAGLAAREPNSDWPDPARGADAACGRRILHIADPHVDAGEHERRTQIEGLLAQEFDYLACTGDVANTKGPFRRFLEWFDGDDRPRFFVPGNHDYWAFGHDRWLLPKVREHGWKTLETENQNWTIIDDVLLVGLWYTRQPQWGLAANQVHYTADAAHFDVRRHIKEPSIPQNLPSVKFSIGHVAPTERLPSRYKPHMMFVNPLVLQLVKAASSPLHLFGHTHERLDQVVDGVRCVNSAMSDRRYKLVDEVPIVHC